MEEPCLWYPKEMQGKEGDRPFQRRSRVYTQLFFVVCMFVGRRPFGKREMKLSCLLACLYALLNHTITVPAQPSPVQEVMCSLIGIVKNLLNSGNKRPMSCIAVRWCSAFECSYIDVVVVVVLLRLRACVCSLVHLLLRRCPNAVRQRGGIMILRGHRNILLFFSP